MKVKHISLLATVRYRLWREVSMSLEDQGLIRILKREAFKFLNHGRRIDFFFNESWQKVGCGASVTRVHRRSNSESFSLRSLTLNLLRHFRLSNLA